MKNDFESIQRFITYSKKVKSEGTTINMLVNIPEMSDDDLKKENKNISKIMVKSVNVMDGKDKVVNKALAATTGAGKAVTYDDAKRSFEKGFGILVKLNIEAVVRGFGVEVEGDVQNALQRTSRVEQTLGEEDQLLLND